MKRLVIAFCSIVALCSMGITQESDVQFVNSPAQATFFDFKTNDLFWGVNVSLIGYKNYIAIEGGLITSGQNLATQLGLGLNIAKLGKSIGLDVNAIFENAKIGGFVARYLEAGHPVQADMAGIYIGTLIKFK